VRPGWAKAQQQNKFYVRLLMTTYLPLTKETDWLFNYINRQLSLNQRLLK
jgi:hypothetical protein